MPENKKKKKKKKNKFSELFVKCNKCSLLYEVTEIHLMKIAQL